MANSIPTIESDKWYVFNNISQNSMPNKYWLNTPSTHSNKNKKSNFPINTNIGGYNIELPIMTPEKARETHNTEIIGLSIAGATIFTATILFLVLKGGPKGISKNFIKFRNALENKIQKLRLDNPDNKKLIKIYSFIVKQADFIINKFEAVNNWNTFKDLCFSSLMHNKYTGSITGSIHSKITRTFERIGRQTVINSYDTTRKNLSSTLGSALSDKSKLLVFKNPEEKVEINGKIQTIAQWCAELAQTNKEISDIYARHFSERPLFGRFNNIKHTSSNLYQSFRNKGIKSLFWSRNTLDSFIADSAIAGEKLSIQNAVKGYRREISYSKTDLMNDADDLIMKMTRSVKYNDFDNLAQLRKIDLNIRKLLKINNAKEYNTMLENILKEINNFEEAVAHSLKDKKITPQTAKNLLENTIELRTAIKEFRQGKIEDVLEIYKKLLPAKEYAKIEKSYLKTVKSLDEAINTETRDFIDKERDLALGSAPTDLIAPIGAAATLGYALHKTDNKQQRQSVLLKYGIPVITGIGTMLYFNARLFAGTKGLLMGTLSTLVVGKIGAWSDKILNKHYEKEKKTKPNSVSSK